jgi:hypothetical protein
MATPIELLISFAQFGRERRISLRDPKASEDFTAYVAQAIGGAITSDALLHGQRTQNMFEALVVSLGNCKLLKTEDAGRCHLKGQFRVPDFRVILNDDSQWLVEVKNIYDHEASRQVTKFTRTYLQQLQEYAGAMKYPLKFALYWARWGIWTLITPEDLAEDGGKLTINMIKAVRVNEMASLGDRTIGTEPPLRLRLLANPEKPRLLNGAEEAVITIAGVEMISACREITDSVEKEIAWILMQFGDWELSGPTAIMSGKEVDALEFTWTPSQRANEGFEMIGTLSSMFARYYASQTLGESGVIQTEADYTPGWFMPLVSREAPSGALPLWRFVLQPNRNGAQVSSSVMSYGVDMESSAGRVARRFQGPGACVAWRYWEEAVPRGSQPAGRVCIRAKSFLGRSTS